MALLGSSYIVILSYHTAPKEEAIKAKLPTAYLLDFPGRGGSLGLAKTSLNYKTMAQYAKPAVNLTYCLYARKSSEQDERQALSIDSQTKEMREMAKRDNLKIVQVYQESHSAKDSGERKVFNQMINGLKNDKFNAILTWAPDRLSRNAGDLGNIVDLMDSQKLVEIRTHGQTFTNSPNEKFLLMILGSQAKLENDHRGENVKRGLKTKAEMGYRPGVSPLGYLNNKGALKGEKKVFLDPVRAPIIKQMFEKVAYEHMSGRDLLHWANDKAKFRTRSGKKLALSTLYLMLRNTYYYGEFEYPEKSGSWYKVSHESIITKELFDLAQENIVVIPKSYGTKDFEFRKLIRCGSCQSEITAEEKFKRFKSGTIRRYVYYHCTRGKNPDCAEPYIREEDLISQLFTLIDKIPIDQLGAKEKAKRELAKYNRFATGVLGDKADKAGKLPEIDVRNYAKYVLREGSIIEKREILSCLTSQLFLTKGILSV